MIYVTPLFSFTGSRIPDLSFRNRFLARPQLLTRYAPLLWEGYPSAYLHT
jgi:hypothetical protein